MNKEYLASLDNIREHFQKTGVISLQEFLEDIPSAIDVEELYQPANYRYRKGTIQLTPLTIDFLENITDKKISLTHYYSFKHKSFDLRKYFEKEGIFFVINMSLEEHKETGGEIYIVKNEEPLAVPTTINTLTMVQITPEDESFITYVNHYISNSGVEYIMGFLE